MAEPPHIHRPRWGAFLRGKAMRIFALSWLSLLFLLAIITPFLAHPLPSKGVVKGKEVYPRANPKGEIFLGLVNDQLDWRFMPIEEAELAPIPYGVDFPLQRNAVSKPPGTLDTTGWKIKPAGSYTKFTHWLGTDSRSRDVLASLLYGINATLGTAVGAAFLTWLLGMLIGMLSGYWGNQQLLISRTMLIALLMGTLLAWFYGYRVRLAILERTDILWGERWGISLLIMGGIFAFCIALAAFWNRKQKSAKSLRLPLDSLTMRGIEILDSIPALLLLLALLSLFTRPDTLTVLIILALIGWTRIARLMRGEYLKATQQDYVKAAKSLGLPDHRILLNHILPNVMATGWVMLIFTISAFLMIEATLSFLNLVEGDRSWGKMMAAGIEHLEHPWVFFPPAIMIFLTVFSLNVWAEFFQEKNSPTSSTE